MTIKITDLTDIEKLLSLNVEDLLDYMADRKMPALRFEITNGSGMSVMFALVSGTDADISAASDALSDLIDQTNRRLEGSESEVE